MPVVEREIADQQIQRASQVAQEMTAGDLAKFAQVVVHCTEAIVRQIRDADDTVATQLRPTVEEGLADLSINVNNLADAVGRIRIDKKGGIF